MPAPLFRSSRMTGILMKFVVPATLLGGLCALVFGDVRGHELVRVAMIVDAFMLLALTYVLHRLSRQAQH